NEHNRVALAGRMPPAPAEGEAHYVGSEACETCHAEAYAWWRGTPHGRAYQPLVDADKQFTPGCVGCHGTGYNRPGGAPGAHNLDGKLVDVGCENCHGLRCSHGANPDAAGLVARDAPEALCVRSHNEEHSDTFHYEAYRAALIAPGHGMPLPAAASKGD